MKLVETANYYMNIVIFATVLIVCILGALLYYFVKVRKVAASEERIDYGRFNRISSLEYCKFDDIISDGGKGLGGAGMIVMDSDTFITGIEVVGYNYDHASASERQRTMMNAIAFANIIEQPIQMRQTVEAIDISFNIDQFTKARNSLSRQLVELKSKYAELAMQIEGHREDEKVLSVILNNIESLDKQIVSTTWKIKEADEVIRYEKYLQEASYSTDRINQIMFSYHYNPDEFVEELTKEEIYIKAMTALSSKINIFSQALSGCGCSCRPLSADSLTGLIYRHMHPLSADRVKIGEIIDGNMEDLFITSDSLFDLEKERLGETGYMRFMEKEERSALDEKDEAISGMEDEIYALSEEIDAYDGLYFGSGEE